MQAITRENLVNRARELLLDGTVTRVLGWKAGDLPYDVTPACFSDEKSLDDFVWNGFCGANLSKYLISETRKEGKILIFLKPCDSFSFNQLLTEHRIDRSKVYALALPCPGMLDVSRIRAKADDGIRRIAEDDGKVTVSTLYDGDLSLDRADCLPDRCLCCKSHVPAEGAYDERLGEESDYADPAWKSAGPGAGDRFAQVEALEAMTPDERYAFWQDQLSRCIRCNACRDVCPACSCEKCVFDNPASGMENKAAANPFEEKLFHIIRAFHVAGRCTDCGECSRVCPQHIPLHLLNRKFIHDMNRLYGSYQAGAATDGVSPLTAYTPGDPEPSAALDGIFPKGGADRA